MEEIEPELDRQFRAFKFEVNKQASSLMISSLALTTLA